MGHAGSVDDERDAPETSREETRQRLDAIHTRIGELQAGRQNEATPAAVRERLSVAQRHLAAAQAAADRAIAASVGAFRRAADAHEHAALQYERAAAAGFGDKGEHERQAALHRAAAAADRQRAERARSLLRDEQADDAGGPDADQALNRAQADAAGAAGDVGHADSVTCARRKVRARSSSRETCIWEMPRRSPICSWVRLP